MTKVIIVITTYNLDQYIGEALDSLLKQKTNFPYKIIVADDCSTDNTVSILKQYQANHPNMIELMLSDRNMGSLANSNRLFDGLPCEYFSFLDGDDYWVGDDRLQKQVDFLDSHPECSMCGGNTQYLKKGNLSDYVVNPQKTNKSYSFQSMLDGEIPFVHTSSLMVRNSIFVNGLPKCYKDAENTFENCALRGEDFRRILHLEQGNLFIMNDVLSVYRIHPAGMWQGSSVGKKCIETAITCNYYRKYFGDKYGTYFHDNALKSYREMMKILTVNYVILDSFHMNESETYLYTSLLRDLQKNPLECKHASELKRKLYTYALKLFYKMAKILGKY